MHMNAGQLITALQELPSTTIIRIGEVDEGRNEYTDFAVRGVTVGGWLLRGEVVGAGYVVPPTEDDESCPCCDDYEDAALADLIRERG